MIKRRRLNYVPRPGDRVKLRYDDDDSWGPGKVLVVGPQQSIWRADRDKKERVTSNRFLEPTED